MIFQYKLKLSYFTCFWVRTSSCSLVLRRTILDFMPSYDDCGSEWNFVSQRQIKWRERFEWLRFYVRNCMLFHYTPRTHSILAQNHASSSTLAHLSVGCLASCRVLLPSEGFSGTHTRTNNTHRDTWLHLREQYTELCRASVCILNVIKINTQI